MTPVYSWADRRGDRGGCALRGELDEDAVPPRGRAAACTRATGRRSRRGCASATRRPASACAPAISPGEYVQRRLLGDAAASISMASGTGLLDQRTCTWDEELTRGIEDRLPPIDDSPRSGLTAEWAERWPGLRDAPWFPAWGDGACSNLGSGCGTLERAALMVGTSGALRVLWRTEEVPEITRGLWRYRLDAERVVIGGSLSDGGSVVAWLRRLTRLPEDAREAERAIAAMEPDAHGLTVLPLRLGERGPGLERRGRRHGRRPHARHRAARPAAREPRGRRAALPPDRARAQGRAARRALFFPKADSISRRALQRTTSRT